MRKLHSFRKFHRPKAVIKKRMINKAETSKLLENVKINPMKVKKSKTIITPMKWSTDIRKAQSDSK